jgi:DNA polymerase-4
MTPPTSQDTGKRSILHVDMDAFFAAIEILDNPRLRGKPVIVGGTPDGHGVVATASYEARKFGVGSAMPAAQAVRLCPHGIFLRPRMGRYASLSRHVQSIFRDTTPLVEPVSIDEAFLDVTGCVPRTPTRHRSTGEGMAREVQERIERETGGLTCSVGVAENKFLAKVASDLQKPRGLVVVPPGGGAAFLAPLPVERLWGVGPKTAERLRAVRLYKVGELAQLPEKDLQRVVGKEVGSHLYRLARGLDDRPVETDWEAQSISQETTFSTFIRPGDWDRTERVLFELADGVAFKLRQDGFWGRTVKLKARDDRFTTCTRSLTLPAPTQLVEEIFSAAVKLFRERVRFGHHSVRLLGVGIANLSRESLRQLDLFEEDAGGHERATDRARVADAIRKKLGDGAILRGRLLEGRERK